MEFRPAYLHGYPSAIDVLAGHILRHGNGLPLPQFRAILLGSEGCLPSQRERISQAFSTRVYSWYGQSERVILAGECETSSSYHSFPDYGRLEIIDENGNPAALGEQGEIVGTGFLNRSLPLIRYRTGDFATPLEPSCECGRHWDRFAQVQGRWKQEMVIGRNGAKISIAALNMHGPLFERVTRYQYHQAQPGLCDLRLMVSPGFTENDAQAIKRAYLHKVGDELQIDVSIVDNIGLTPRGKLKLLDSRINNA